jgi:hypothetical protein
MPRCNGCFKIFPSPHDCKQHKDNTGHWVLQHRCETCDKEFNTRAAADQHMLILGHRKPSFPCQSCDKKFPDPKAADQHMMAKRHYALTSLSISPTNSSDRHSVSRPSSPEPKGHDINKAGFTYRVQGVPLDWNRNDLEGFLAETGQITMPTVFSLFEEVNRKWQTATIACAEPPPNSLRQLEPLTIDSEFYGFTTLYAPSKEDHQIEYV